MDCIILNKEGGKSQLYETIFNEIANKNQDLANELFKFFETEQFKNMFGGDPFQMAETNKDLHRLNDSKEVLLQYNKTARKYYFLDKNNQQVFFPLINRGINSLWTQEQIKDITSRLTASYIKRNTTLNFNNIDFSEINKLPNVKQFINKEINKRLKYFEEKEEWFRHVMLEEGLQHLDELEELVIKKLKSISINVKTIEEDEISEEDIISEETRENFSKASFERSNKEKVSTNVKLRLSLLSDPNKKDEIWDDNVLLEFDTVYSKLQNLLSNYTPSEGENLYETYLSMIENNIKYFPYLQTVYDMLTNNKDANFKYEFTSHFYLTKLNHLSNKIKKTDDGLVQTSLNLSDITPKKIQVRDIYNEKIKNKLSKTNSAKELIQKYISEFNKINIETLENLNNYKEKLILTLNWFGLDINDEILEHFIDNNVKEINYNNIKLLHTKILNSLWYFVKNYKDNNFNYLNADSIFNKLLDSELSFYNELSDANTRIGGNQRWVFSNPSYLTITLDRWKKDPSILLNMMKSDIYIGKNSFLLNKIFGYDINPNQDGKSALNYAKNKLNNVTIGVLGELQIDGKELQFKETSDLSYKDYLINQINSVNNQFGFTRTITQADKKTEYNLSWKERFKKSIKVFNNDKKVFDLSDEVKNTFFNYFKSEINRMIKVKKEVETASLNNSIKLTPHYHYKYKVKDSDGNTIVNPNIYDFSGNAFKSQYFDKLNVKDASSKLEKEIVNLVYEKGIVKNNINYDQLQILFEQYLNEMITDEISKVITEWSELGIISNENNEFKNILISNEIFNDKKYTSSDNKRKLEEIASDFLVNSIMLNIEYTKLFTGDITYYKDSVDFKKRVPATYTDGKQLVLNKDEINFNIATIESVEIESPFIEKLRESGLDEDSIATFSKINAADAQAWITPERWKFLVTRLGKWSDVYESVYKKMQSGKKEEFTKQELKAAAQPIKGVYFYKDHTGKPTYLKYSQAVLSKSLVKDSPLEKVLNAMYENKVDELITFDGVKVGAIEPTKIHDKNGNIIDDIILNVQTLNNYGWKLQQDLPTKNFKNTDVGSQIQKNIMAGLTHYLDNTNFFYKGEFRQGHYIYEQIVKAVTNLSDLGYQKLIDKCGIDENGEIKNISKFYKALIDELKSRGGSDNVIKALKAETSILGIPQTTNKLYQIFASMINKNIIKIKTNGGSFVQMSNFGLSYENIKDGDTGIVLNPNLEKTTSEPYIYTDENGKKRVKPGGIFIASSFIAKKIPNWKKYTNEELFVSYNGGDSIISKDIIENIIGYRIPNQGLPSNDSLFIAGILPESAGDVVVAYTGITAKTGSDFDIDKMYVMFPSFKKIDGRLVYNKEDSANTLIELYKAVLTNPDVYSDIMKSIDNDFIKNEINALKPDNSNSFMKTLHPIDDIKLRYYFLGGKAGVGQEANAMTDIWRFGKLFVNKFKHFKWGNFENDNINLDEQYSKELSEEDLNYYAKEMLKKEATKEQIENFKNSMRKIKIGETLGTILNAFVDIAKDPYISKGNWVTSTTNVGNLMIRMGAHPLYVVNFLANPIIEEYIEFQKNNEGLFDNNSGDIFKKFRDHLIIKELNKININYSKYLKDYKQFRALERIIDREEANNEILEEYNKIQTKLKNVLKDNYNDFINNISIHYNNVFEPLQLNIFDNKTEQYNKPKFDLKFYREEASDKSLNLDFRMRLLREFKIIQDLSKQMKQIVDFGKLDVNGVGKDPNNIFIYDNILKNILTNNEEEPQILGFESKLNNTVLKSYYNNLSKIKDILNKNPLIFPLSSDNVKKLFDTISYYIYNSSLVNQELSDKLNKNFRTYIYENVFKLDENYKEELLNEFYKEIKQQKIINKNKYFIIDELIIDKNKILLESQKKSEEYENMIINSWRELFIDNPSLAEKLVHYNFVTNGFNKTRGEFYSYIPYEYFVQLDINTKIKEQFNDDLHLEFINKFYLNNLKDGSIVNNLLVSDVESIESGKTVKESSLITVNNDEFTNKFIKVLNNYYIKTDYQNDNKNVYQKIENKPLNYINYNIELKLTDVDLEQYNVKEAEIKEINNDFEIKTEETKIVNNSSQIIFEEEQSAGYRNRTIKNASADATIAMAVDFNSAGEKLTKSSVLNQNKKYIPLNANNLTVTKERVDKIVEKLNSVNAKTLNIAGNGIYTIKGKYTQQQIDNFTFDLLNQVMNSPNLKTKIISIRSGGQTGFDEAGTKAGIKLGLPTLTLAPKGWTFRNEQGQDISNEQQFKARFGNFNQLQQQDLFLSAATNFEQVEKQWLNGGYTKEDWDNMNEEEREHIIKNCLQ